MASQKRKTGVKTTKEYEVEGIVAKKVTASGTVLYLVKWAGYHEKDNTWEPIANLKNCAEAIKEFEQRYGKVYQGGSEEPVASSSKGIKAKQEKKGDAEKEVSGDEGKLAYYQKFLSPLYCEDLGPDQVPVAILASVTKVGVLAHGVRLAGETTELTEEALKAPYDNLNEKNFAVVNANFMNEHYPELVIQYYQKALKLVDSGKSEAEQMADAARARLMHAITFGVSTDGEDLLTVPPKNEDEQDKFGLPVEFGKVNLDTDTEDN